MDDGHAAGLPRLERAEELQTTVSRFLVPLRVTAPDSQDFRAVVESAGTTRLSAGRVRCAPHSVLRESRSMSSTDPDLFKVTLHRRGSGWASQGGRQHPVRTGDLLALDTTRPYTLALPEPCDVVVVGLPRWLLGPHARTPARRSGEPVPTDAGMGALCAALLTGLGDHVDTLGAPHSEYLLDAVTGLLISALAEVPAERVETQSAAVVDRIVAYTLANLADPDLCAASVAARHGISVRWLHQLFKGRERPFTAWVRYERLKRIRRELSDPAFAHRTIAAVAAHWGVLDPTHLARALRDEFGCTAAEMRRRGAGSRRVRRLS